MLLLRAALLLVVLVAPADARPPLRLEAARDVEWGYGCGGNCAIRNTGRSTLLLTSDGKAARLLDEGWHALHEHHPGGGMVQTTRWKNEWSGRAREEGDKLRFDLGGESVCSRIEEHEEAGQKREITTGCPRAPKKLRVECVRSQVLIDGGKTQAVWICRSPARPPGTVQPWVFGIGAVVDERLAGEPEAEATYRLR